MLCFDEKRSDNGKEAIMAEDSLTYEPTEHAFRGFTDNEDGFWMGNAQYKKFGGQNWQKQGGDEKD